jgi:predicted nucleic acid-binding protein
MAFLIAADVIIQAERKKLDLEGWLRAHPDEEVKIAAITVAELWRSSEKAAPPQRTVRQKFLKRMFEVVEVVPYGERAAIEHARLWAMLEATGQRIGMQDLILAATAIDSGATVLTTNARRFSAVPGLTVAAP